MCVPLYGVRATTVCENTLAWWMEALWRDKKPPANQMWCRFLSGCDQCVIWKWPDTLIVAGGVECVPPPPPPIHFLHPFTIRMELFWVQIGFHQLLSAPQQTADEGDIPHSSCFPSRKCYKTSPNDVRRFFFKLLSLVLSNVWTIYGRQLSTKASVAHSVSATSTPEHWTTFSCLMCFCVSWLFIHLFCLYLTSDLAKRQMEKK